MKKQLGLSVCILLLMAFGNTALAAERIVQLDIPGCRPCGAAHRISAIMKKVEAVQKYENKESSLLIITFDDKKGSVKTIIDELKKGGFAVKGNPVFLK